MTRQGLKKETDTERTRGKKRNLHVDQADPVAQEALALLVDPVHNKEKEKDAINISNHCKTLSSFILLLLNTED